MDSRYRLWETLELRGVPLDPIIVLGMHRSGTTMLVKVLQSAGVFMGKQLSGNYESRVFQDANRQIFDYFNASWMNGHLLPNPDILYRGYSGLAAAIAARLTEDLPVAFFDSMSPSCKSWGFKDPRLSVSAGLFLRLFPEARAFFIYRDPLDVAWSIVTREKKQKRKHPGLERYEFSQQEFEEMMIRSIKSWECYNTRALEGLLLFSHFSTVRYESLVRHPIPMLTSVLAGLGIEVSEERIDKLPEFHIDRIGSAEKSGLDLSKFQDYLAESPVARRLDQMFVAQQGL